MAALITPAPRHMIGARDDGPLLGYFIVVPGNSTQTLYCGAGNIFITSDDYGGCYGTDYAASTSTLAYGCTDQTTRTGDQSGGLVTCTPGTVFWTCVTQTIFATFPNISPVTNYFCGNDYSALDIYRDIPSTTSSSALTSSSLQSPSSTSTSPLSTSITAPTTTQSTAPAHKPASSEAWISGPVLGTIALIALISIAIWYLRNRRREQDYRFSYITQQEEQKRVSGIVGSGSSRNELP